MTSLVGRNGLGSLTPDEKRHALRVLRKIHHRIEEKFKDYRNAFRDFDINVDGVISFQEFMTGCEYCGIHLPIKDSKLAFDLIDYDNAKSIDFKKFSLINTDNSKSIFEQIEEAEKAKVNRREKYEQ